MDPQDSLVSERSAEVHVDMSSEGIITDIASQDGRVATEEGTTTNKASQDSRRPLEVMPTPEVNEYYRPLFVAAQRGDWKSAKKILNEDRKAMTAEIMVVKGESITVLDVAIMASQDQLVKNLINCFPLEYKDFDFNISLETAALRGRKKMVKAFANKVDAESKSVCNALWKATQYDPKQKEVIWYLAKRTKCALRPGTIFLLTRAGHLDIALYLAHQYRDSMLRDEYIRIFGYFAKMESNFRSRARLNFWEKSIDKFIGIPLCLVDTPDNSKETKMPQAKRFKISLSNYATMPDITTWCNHASLFNLWILQSLKNCLFDAHAAFFIKRIGLRHECSLKFANLVLSKMKTQMDTPKILDTLSSIVLDAASRGISEIVRLCFEHFPELTWNKSFMEEVMRKVVKQRHVELFRLLNAPGTSPLLNNDTRNDLLKEVLKWSPTCLPKDVSGAPFLMQRELQWFKVLEDTSDLSSKSVKIKKVLSHKFDSALKSHKSLEDEKPYWDEFVGKRTQLLKEAGQWMKDTSSSCSLVSTLIITVAFAAAFTVPGGNDGSTGIPIFLKRSSFMVFAVADALALFSSVTATLMFLAILTSRYGAEDFLKSLPLKMILGLTFLFLSLAFMLVSFGSALTIVLSEQLKWIYVPITLLAAIPVVLFAILHLPLYIEMVESTYSPRLYRLLKLWE